MNIIYQDRVFTTLSRGYPIPVSYTHLDVYKRQGNANVTSIKGVIAEKTQELDKLTQNYHRKMCIRDRYFMQVRSISSLVL